MSALTNGKAPPRKRSRPRRANTGGGLKQRPDQKSRPQDDPTPLGLQADSYDEALLYAEPNPFIGALGNLICEMEARLLSVLYRSDDEDQAVRLIHGELPLSAEGRRLADRVMNEWAAAYKRGETLRDALIGMDDEEAWSIRVRHLAVDEFDEAERILFRLAGEIYNRECGHG